MLHLNIPTGSYLLFGSIEFRNSANFFNSDNTRDVGCKFSTDSANNVLGSIQKIQGLSNGLLTLHSVTTTASGGVDLQCQIINGNSSQVTPQGSSPDRRKDRGSD